MARNWVRLAADGLAVEGPCLVHTIIFTPNNNDEYAEVYDGRDATAGKLFCRVIMFREETAVVDLGQGVRFDRGVYVGVENLGDAVTIVFTPLTE